MRSQIKTARARRRVELREFIREYKLEKGCAICGYRRSPFALEAHHKNDDKEFNIGTAIGDDVSKIRIIKELVKCVILCANCHRMIHRQVDPADLDGLRARRRGNADADRRFSAD